MDFSIRLTEMILRAFYFSQFQRYGNDLSSSAQCKGQFIDSIRFRNASTYYNGQDSGIVSPQQFGFPNGFRLNSIKVLLVY